MKGRDYRLDQYPLDVIERNLILSPVVKPRRSRRLVVGDVLCENYRSQHDPNTRGGAEEKKQDNRQLRVPGGATTRFTLARRVRSCSAKFPTTRRLATSPDVQTCDALKL